MKLIVSIIFLSLTIHVQGQKLRVNGKYLEDAVNDNVILRGIGLGGWMLQEPYMLQLSGIAANQQQIRDRIKELAGDEKTAKIYQSWLANHCTKTDIDSLASWGFNAVRLPMHFNLFTLPIEKEPRKGKNTWLKEGFRLTDSLLSWCAANKIYLILDLHAAPGGQGNDVAISDRDTAKPSLWQNELNKQKTVALWEKLAERYANSDWIGGYDIINEPNWGFQDKSDKNGCAEKLNAPLKKLLQDITKAIRKKDQQHIIFIEGNCWGNNYDGIFPLWDNQTVISFHKYWNVNTPASIQKFLDYREKYTAPIWMGESGENSNAWFTDAVKLLEEHRIGWTWWPLKKLGINNPLQVKTNKGYQQIIDYLKGKAPKPSKEQAFAALMQLTKDLNIRNNIYRVDVIDALFRQVHTTEVIPFKNHSINSNAVLFAVDYDLGRLDYAYHDSDAGNYWVSTSSRTDWNKGWQYRNDGVDIETCSDSISNGYSVGWIIPGEWMQYTVYSPEETNYDIQIRSASKEKDAAAEIDINGNMKMVKLPFTGDHANWQTTTVRNLKLNKGWNKIRVKAITGGYNLNYLRFIETNLAIKQ